MSAVRARTSAARTPGAVPSSPVKTPDPEPHNGAPADHADRAPAGAQVVDRVVDILETFLWLGPELGVSEISRTLGLKKATTHRLLASLRRRNMVAQDPVTRRYRLGGKLWELGSIATSQIDWAARVKPFLEDLTRDSGETSHLAVFSDGQVLYVEKVESSKSLRMPSQVGRRLPFHCTGVGKALVAYFPDEVLDGLIARRGLPRFTSNTITDPAKLHRSSRARASGVIPSTTKRSRRASSASGRPCGTTAPTSWRRSASPAPPRGRAADAPRHAALVMTASNAISRALGWQAEPSHSSRQPASPDASLSAIQGAPAEESSALPEPADAGAIEAKGAAGAGKPRLYTVPYVGLLSVTLLGYIQNLLLPVCCRVETWSCPAAGRDARRAGRGRLQPPVGGAAAGVRTARGRVEPPPRLHPRNRRAGDQLGPVSRPEPCRAVRGCGSSTALPGPPTTPAATRDWRASRQPIAGARRPASTT